MSHPFGDLLSQYLHRKHGLSQAKLAAGILQDPAIVARMCRGDRLTGRQARSRVVAILVWLYEQEVLGAPDEANALLAAGGMATLSERDPVEANLLHQLSSLTRRVKNSRIAPTHNLPPQLTSFIGRKREMAEVRSLLADTRLLTLSGSGGCGKTRLALEVGFAILHEPDQYPDGVWLVELAPLSNDGQIMERMLATIGAVFDLRSMSRSPLAVLIDYLADKNLLLVLDNCEHVIGACAELAGTLLRACSGLHILATSREPLSIAGEVTWSVLPLAIDEAVELFIARARAIHPGFEVNPITTSFVMQVCRRLDALPFALELVAVRVRTFSIVQIAAWLDEAFQLLTSGSRTTPSRQQTLQATIDWSYDLLRESERGFLCELAVFVDGWTLEAAKSLHGDDALELLDHLVAKSLVVVEEVEAGQRYRLLEMVRHYAYRKLVEAGMEADMRWRHLSYFAGLAGTAYPVYLGLYSKSLAMLLQPEVGNMRAALAWAAQAGDWRTGGRLIDGITDVWIDLGHGAELVAAIDRVILSNPAASEGARAEALIRMGWLATGRGDMVECVKWFGEASRCAHQLQDEQLIQLADCPLGFTTPDYAQAVALLQEVMQKAHQSGQTAAEVAAMHRLGCRMSLHGDYESGLAWLERSLALARETGDLTAQAVVLFRTGEVFLMQGDYERARVALSESNALDLRVNPAYECTNAQIGLGTVALHQGNYDEARKMVRPLILYHYKVDNMERLAQDLVLAAGLAQGLGRVDQATWLLGTAAAIRRDHHTHGVFERELFADYDRRLPAVRVAMDPSGFEKAWEKGQKLTIKEAIAEAMAI